jgi:hypothetical protein
LHGWLRKDSYGHSNRLWSHDIGKSYIEARLKAILESSEQEWNVDLMISNLVGIPVLLRSGTLDRAVHSWESRRFYRILKENSLKYARKNNITKQIFTELKDKEHWFWDSLQSTDGGVVNDAEIRQFISNCINTPFENIYAKKSKYTLFNPATSYGKSGIQVLVQEFPFQKSTVEIEFLDNGLVIYLKTKNVKNLKLKHEYFLSKNLHPSKIKIDDHLFELVGRNYQDFLFIRSDSTWSMQFEYEKDIKFYGPIRSIFSKPYALVVNTKNDTLKNHFINAALYLSIENWMTSYHGSLSVLYDYELTPDIISKFNLIRIGNDHDRILEKIPLLRGKEFGYVVRNGKDLLLGSSNLDRLYDILDCAATPTIPPMTRSPLAYLIPDVFVVGEESRMSGYGGVLAAGFWNNQGDFDSNLFYI